MRNDIQQVLLSADEISARVKELGAEISAEYAGKEILMIGVLRGAVVFMADLARAITVPVAIDFMAVSSYGTSTTSSGVVRIMKDLDEEVAGRHILVVEDIIDSGLTLNYLLDNLKARRPASCASRSVAEMAPELTSSWSSASGARATGIPRSFRPRFAPSSGRSIR